MSTIDTMTEQNEFLTHAQARLAEHIGSPDAASAMFDSIRARHGKNPEKLAAVVDEVLRAHGIDPDEPAPAKAHAVEAPRPVASPVPAAGPTAAPKTLGADSSARTPAKKAPVPGHGGMTDGVLATMPALARRLYAWAKARADRDGTFTCVRTQAAACLVASPRRVGYSMKLHQQAGVWTVSRRGVWTGGQGWHPQSRTLFRLSKRFHRGRASEIYLEAKNRAAERTRGLQNRDTGPSE